MSKLKYKLEKYKSISFAEYLSQNQKADKNKTGKKIGYVCRECNGWGKKYDPEDCDSIEGYKLAHHKIHCTVCNGKGYLLIKEMKKLYDVGAEWVKKENKKRENFINLLLSAENKLTGEEINAINQFVNR